MNYCKKKTDPNLVIFNQNEKEKSYSNRFMIKKEENKTNFIKFNKENLNQKVNHKISGLNRSDSILCKKTLKQSNSDDLSQKEEMVYLKKADSFYNENYPRFNSRPKVKKHLHSNSSLKKENKIDNLVYSTVNINNLIITNENIMKSIFPYKKEKEEKLEEESMTINLENLLILEEKISDVIYHLKENKFNSNNCLEYWNFRNFCSFQFETFFKEETSKKVVYTSMLLEFLSIIILYELIVTNKTLSIKETFEDILSIIYQSYLVICKYIISKVTCEAFSNVWFHKLQTLIQNRIKHKSNNYIHILILNQNNTKIEKMLSGLLSFHIESNSIKSLNNYLINISNLTLQDLNELFKKQILIVENQNASVPASAIQDFNHIEIPGPYIETKSKKVYTLVLDLDETLIHFKSESEESSKGEIRLRPGLFEFLDAMRKLYELVIFTAATQEYADIILDAIETNKKYFAFRLYRHHCIIIDDEFVKDLSKIGRDLKKTIIIDNLPQNFRLQNKNGIFIKSFYGEDSEDNALIDLIPILKGIIENNPIDIRNCLSIFKDEILKNISSHISKS